MAAALALAPVAVWPACCDVLTQLMNPAELHSLHVNDLRIFRTPRGKLMIEEFRSQLAPDELIAQRSAPVKASARRQDAAGAEGDAAAKKGGAKKKAALSKEEQQRQDMLEAEVCMHACMRLCTPTHPYNFTYNNLSMVFKAALLR
jgi:hypothetical protein